MVQRAIQSTKDVIRSNMIGENIPGRDQTKISDRKIGLGDYIRAGLVVFAKKREQNKQNVSQADGSHV